MNQAAASRMVFLAGGLMAVYVLIRAGRGANTDTFKSLWAIGVLTLGLAVMADFVPQVAGPFSLLVLIAMAVRQRGELGAVIGGAGKVAGPPASALGREGAAQRPSSSSSSPTRSSGPPAGYAR